MREMTKTLQFVAMVLTLVIAMPAIATSNSPVTSPAREAGAPRWNVHKDLIGRDGPGVPRAATRMTVGSLDPSEPVSCTKPSLNDRSVHIPACRSAAKATS